MNGNRFMGLGYKLDNGDAVYIGNLPHRKQVCLYEEIGSRINVLAYFKTHEQAHSALKWLGILLTGEDT